MHILFVDACMRTESRTAQLSKHFLKNIVQPEDTVQTVKVSELDIQPFDEEMLMVRDRDVAEGCFDAESYQLAKDFASADRIIIAAPYWDCLFPAKLKTYLEHICVNGITFGYDSMGQPQKLCRADRLIYITTAGGFVNENPSVKLLMEEMCAMFGIRDVRFHCAQALDIYPENVQSVLNASLESLIADYQ